ncbi:MAG: hypothetical protein BHW15_03655 [Coprococcus sp. CAG:131_42_139]|jgi:hypothetical protein|nr:MAG: hypothetical protein BHW15_03655 [Coprococcus sp. CAG:131_42_139]
MKKRLFIGLLVGAMCVGLVGCGGDNDLGNDAGSGSSESVSTEAESETEEASSEESTEKKGLSAVDTSVLTEKLPDMVSAFPDREIKGVVVDDSYVRYGIDDVESDTFDAYVRLCQDAGYVSNTSQGSDDTGSHYWAYTEDGQYYLEIMYTTSDKHASICLTDESKQ